MVNLLFDLKCDLATRSTNKHIGSGLGGNISEFYFLLSKNSDIVYQSDSWFQNLGFEDKNKILFK